MKNVNRVTAVLIAMLMVLTGIAQAEVFTSESQGFGGTVSVQLTIEDGAITDVQVEGDSETPEVGGAAIPVLAEQVKESQSADIDGVAGATFTSTAVKEATAAALASASGDTAEAVSLTPGTYTSTQEGFQHKMSTVEVTVDESSIVSVEVVSSDDHPWTVAEKPIKLLPAEIVEKQSYAVDSISGATFTSNAIKRAVKDCLDQAGGSAAFNKPESAPELVAGEDVETDVLVVGAGGAGFMAAVFAYTGEDAEDTSGLKVTLIEKTDVLGGSTGFSGGARYYYEDETGEYSDEWYEQIFEKELADRQEYNKFPVNEELLRGEVRAMPKVNAMTAALGMNDIKTENITNTYIATGPYEGFPSDDFHMGSNMVHFMDIKLPELDIDLRTHTAATDLLTNDAGEVIGARVEDKTSFYNIYAKKVILATGGFPRNTEMIEQYAPGSAGVELFYCGAGNTGDGLRMAVELGAQTVGDTMYYYLGNDPVCGFYLNGDYNFTAGIVRGASIALDVNINGERFCDESIVPSQRYVEVMKQPEKMMWAVLDSDNPTGELVRTNTSEYVVHADTLEELAELMGVPADKLVESAEAYNAAIENGEDTAFGTPVEFMDTLSTAPYYAMMLKPVAISSMVGVNVDGECHVLNQDGEPIPNLFAVGDMVMGGNYLSYYRNLHGVAIAMYTGGLAGMTAKAELIG